MTRVLLAGESWNTYAIHTKGGNSYTTSAYEEGADVLIGVLSEAGHEVSYMPNHRVVEDFPYSVADLAALCDVVMLSDLPSDSLLLPHAVFIEGQRRPDRTAVLADFVRAGGGLCMVGGYMSFAGFEGRARWGATRLAEALPVTMSRYDDRTEVPDGVNPMVVASHEVVAGLPEAWPYFLGYNQVVAKPEAQVVVTAGADPLLVVGSLGEGRTAAFTSDCAPHWGSPEFMAWPGYAPFWSQLVTWLAGQ